MAVSVSMRYVRKAETYHWGHFSTMVITGDETGEVTLFFNEPDHKSKAVAVANAINGVTE